MIRGDWGGRRNNDLINKVVKSPMVGYASRGHYKDLSASSRFPIDEFGADTPWNKNKSVLIIVLRTSPIRSPLVLTISFFCYAVASFLPTLWSGVILVTVAAKISISRFAACVSKWGAVNDLHTCIEWDMNPRIFVTIYCGILPVTDLNGMPGFSNAITRKNSICRSILIADDERRG